MPVRGDLLPFWDGSGAFSALEIRRWERAAERIAVGVATLAHLDAFVDVEARRVGFLCSGSVELASAFALAIVQENIEARQAVAPMVEPGSPTAEVHLPCHPNATDEEVRHVVLATLKASHRLAAD